MKYLLNGVAIAAVLVIAAPAWAQAVPGQPNLQKGIPGAGTASPTTNSPPSAPMPAPMAPAATAPMGPPPPMATSQPSHMPKGHRASASSKPRHRAMKPVATTADQLNAQELTTLQGGAPPPPMPMTSVPGQPSLQQGMPGAGNVSPSPPKN